MKSFICNAFRLSLLISLGLTHHAIQAKDEISASDTIAQDIQQQHALTQELLEPLFVIISQQLNTIDCALQDIACNLSTNSAVKTKNNQAALANIRILRQFVGTARNTQHVVLSTQLLHKLNAVINFITTSLTDALKNGLETLDASDLDRICFDVKKDVSPEQLAENIEINERLIKSIEKLSDNLGLAWYNKAYRLFKRVIVEPAKLLAAPAFLTTSAALSALCLWYYFGGENPQWLRSKIGWPIKSDEELRIIHESMGAQKKFDLDLFRQLYAKWLNGNMPEEMAKEALEAQNNAGIKLEQATGWLGQTEQVLFRLLNGRYVIGSSLLAFGYLIAKKLFPDIGSTIINKVKAFDDLAMGGAYKNRQTGSVTFHTGVNLDNVIGQEDAKLHFRMLIAYLKNSEPWNRCKIGPITSVLLHGESRTGKTFSILAFLGEIEKTLGEKAKYKIWKVPHEAIIKFGIQKILDSARSEAPCIVVIEEIDLLGLQRTVNPERLSAFMTAMSSCLVENTLDKNVIIIATTNKLENLDPALRQEGRFGKAIHFDYPSFSERKIYIEKELGNAACNLNNFAIDKLAYESEGMCFEKLANFIADALRRAKMFGEPICQQSLEQSIDDNLRGISRNEISLTDEQKSIVAAHLAGHATANFLLGANTMITKITLHDVTAKIEEKLAIFAHYKKDIQGHSGEEEQKAIEHGKVFVAHKYDIVGIESREEKIKQCKIALAGHIAETVLLGSCGYSYHQYDDEIARNIATKLIFQGIDKNNISKKKCNRLLSEVDAMIDQCKEEVTTLLQENKDKLTAVLDALINKTTLDTCALRILIFGPEEETKDLGDSDLISKILGSKGTSNIASSQELLSNTAA